MAACACARLALPHAKDGAARAAIEMAEAWCRGEATVEQVRAAYAAADAAAAYAYAATDAAGAAAYAAAYAAAAAAYAAADAADAAAAAAADAAAARAATLRQCADIVRKHRPVAPEIGACV
jgi:hypothetical protein